jgi:hypothetical protein
MNKRGADKVLSVYWFAILAIVAAGVFAMVYSFNNVPYDVREIEANLLIDKITDCLITKGEIDFERINGNFDLEKECHLKIGTEEYFIEILFYDFDTNGLLRSISAGNVNIKSDCEIQKNEKYNLISKCVEQRVYSTDNQGNEYLIEIKTGIKKTDKNAR